MKAQGRKEHIFQQEAERAIRAAEGFVSAVKTLLER